MKLLPFVLTRKQTDEFTLYIFRCFLSRGGKALWETDTSEILTTDMILREYCEPNGFQVQDIYVNEKKALAYIKVDPEKTNLKDFYTWEESLALSEKPECWRIFSFILEKGGSIWWSPKGLLEAEISGAGNIQDLFDEVLSWSSRSKDSLQSICI